MSPKTELRFRRLLVEAQLLDGDPEALPDLEVLKTPARAGIPDKLPQQESSVAEWSDEVTAMLERGATPTAIFDRLRLERDDFQGSLSAIKLGAVVVAMAVKIAPWQRGHWIAASSMLFLSHPLQRFIASSPPPAALLPGCRRSARRRRTARRP